MRAYKLKDIISQGTKDLFYIWWQELKAVVKDQGVLIFFILVPSIFLKASAATLLKEFKPMLPSTVT